MSKLFLLFLLIIPSFSFTQTSSAYYRVGDYVYIHAQSGLNMRSAAQTSGPKTGTIPYGSKVRVTAIDWNTIKIKDFGGYTIEDCWYKVEHKGKEGFVFGGYISRFPTVSKELNFSDVGAYVRNTFKEKTSLTLEYWEREGQEPNPCHTVKVYEEGIMITLDGCTDKCFNERFLFEDTQVSEVASILKAVLDRGKDAYTFKFDEKSGLIKISMDMCEISIQEISSGGVILDVWCCC